MNSFYHFFIARFEQEEEDYSRARLIINFTIISISLSWLFAVLHAQFQFHIPQWLFICYGVVLIIVLFVFRFPLSISQMAHTIIAMGWVSFLFGISYSGGIYSLVLPWLLLMPLMANLLIHQKAAIGWLVLAALSLISILFFFDHQPLISDDKAVWRSLIGNIGLVVIVFLFTESFSRSKARLLNALKESNADLFEQKEEVLTQNEELTQQRDEITVQRHHIEEQNELLRKQFEQIEKTNQELELRASEIFNRNATLEEHWHTLLNISKSRSVNFGDSVEALRDITKTAAHSLKTHRVSVWQYLKETKSIKCLMLYEWDTDTFKQDEELQEKEFPRYFEALMKEEVIPADEAETDQYTFEFKDNYLRPHHIQSMLDTPYFLDGKLSGVICCEHHEHRHWLPEDIIFAQALSDIVSLMFRALQRRQYEARIREQKKEITRINQSLEQRIKERTHELENQNQQLAEYAFINSHLLRAPLCRMLGLIHLIEVSDLKLKEMELVDHLKKSGDELDDVVKRINKAIENGDHFGREHLDNNDNFVPKL
ncbi:MAG: GAF domain-containing protein [Cyclobacteriaceae bacterium]|nr:GAF domain-containing protein [Cyclobacteriaceae bacterium]